MQALLSPPTLPADVAARLEAYAALLGRWTQRISLISRGDERHIWARHVLDSLRLVPLIPSGTARGIDLGSGAGLPGLVLAVATGIPFDLVEADRRKAAFLMEARRVTGAPVQVHACRIEEAPLDPAPLVTARALAPLPVLLGLAAPLLAPGGVALFPKGARVQPELETARAVWRFEAELAGPDESPILVVRNLARG